MKNRFNNSKQFTTLYSSFLSSDILREWLPIACQRFFLQSWNQIRNRHHSLMEPLGCTSIMIAHIASVHGSPGISRVYKTRLNWLLFTFMTNLLGSCIGARKVIGESLDLIKYIDTNFEGPSLLPDDPNKLSLAEEMTSYLDTFFKKVSAPLRGNQPVEEAGGEFDYLEKCLEKFDDGPFFLGQFSQVDAAYVPFIERPHIIFLALWNYDITAGRPKLAAYIQELNKIGAYRLTKCDPVALFKLHKIQLKASS